MTLDRWAWGGLMVVAIGWMILLLGFSYAGLAAPANATWASDTSRLAHALILSGFGLAGLGVLKSGFVALDCAFRVVVARAALPVGEHARRSADRPAFEPPAERMPALPKKIVERGRLRDRAYTLFMDGSVEIETLLGLRQFPSLEEAHDFIA